jgi:hypothetical protein
MQCRPIFRDLCLEVGKKVRRRQCVCVCERERESVCANEEMVLLLSIST